MAGLFAEWQPQYAKHGIATFPVRDKRPAVSKYLRMGLPASRELATKFGDADAFGFACGARSGITVIDVDSPDERLLREAENQFGPTSLIIRSGGGNSQLYYRHNGEGRKIRPDKNVPIDILGSGGFVVAPPSRLSWGAYSLVRGSLDDLRHLPSIRHRDALDTAPERAVTGSKRTLKGERNTTLWRHCMRQARGCATLTGLMERAIRANRELFYEPLPADEVLRVVASAWEYESNGENFFGGRKGQAIPHDQVDTLLQSFPDAFILRIILTRHHWGRPFVCSNAMAKIMPGGGWTEKRLRAARQKLEELGEIVLLRPASIKNGPALYASKGGQN